VRAALALQEVGYSMAALNIALLGAPHSGVSQLASLLNGAVKASGWNQLVAVLVAGTSALQADLGSFDLVLLTGLQTTTQSQEAADLSIRARLALAAVSYRVLYGTSEERLAHALNAIESLLPRAEASPRQNSFSASSRKQPWVWMCEKCSDPGCEHRLLTTLLAQRASTV
jgi:hypothetical protein